MLKQNVYVLKDELRGYLGIILSDNDSTALRDFNTAYTNTPNCTDYSIWKVGFFDGSVDMPIALDNSVKLIARGVKTNEI